VTSTNGSLTVHPEMTVTPPSSPFADAVVGRHYGVIADTCVPGPNCAPLTYTIPAAAPGLGGPYTFTPNNFPSGFACVTSTNNGNCSDATGVGGAAGTFANLNVTAKDTANASTPQGAVTSTNGTITVDAEMTLTPPSSPFPAAVVGRHYGVITDTCAPGPNCAPLTYTVAAATPGLGGPYTFTPNNFPSGFACVTSTNNGNCSDSTSVGGSAGTFANLNVTVKDSANAATPQGAVTSTNGSLTVDAEMTLTPPASPFADAVLGRHYGVSADTCVPGPNCLPLTYTVPAATPGLGGYTFTPNNFPAGFACVTSTNNGNCSDATSVGGSAGTFTNLNVTVQDSANAATPSNSVISTNGSLTVHDALALSTNLTSPFPEAVVHRDYGVSTDLLCGAGGNSACTSLIYSATGGLGAYSFDAITNADTPSGSAFPTGFACTPGGNTDTCKAAPVSSSVTAPNTFAPSVTVNDTANAATPAGTQLISGSLAVDAGVAVTLAIGLDPYTASAAWPLGVAGRPYGVGTCAGGSACVAPTYTAAGGLGAVGGYTFPNDTSLTGVGFTCNTSSPTLTCSATNLAGAFTSSVTATDLPNATTPAATATSDTNSIFTSTNPVTVNSELQISNTFLENATVGEPYSATFEVIGPNDVGIGGPYQWCLGTITNATCSAGTGGITGVSFVTPSPAISDDPPQAAFGNLTDRGYYRGTPTTAETGASTATAFQVSDLGNNTTPGCSYIVPSTCPSLTLSATHAPKVFASHGFVANSYAANLFTFDPSTLSAGSSVDLSASAQHPITPRVTPDGQWVYVTAQSAISVVDPTSDTKAVPDVTFTTAGTSTTGPTGLDVETQMVFTGTPTPCTTSPCSNLAPYIRYDAWLVDMASVTTSPNAPTASATVQPIPEAENPGMLPSALVSSNGLTVPYADSIAVAPDASQAWVSLAQNGGLIELDLPFLDAALATSYPAAVGNTFSNLGINGGAVAADPRYNLVYTVEWDQTNTYPYIAVTTSGNPDPGLSANTLIANLPTSAGYTGTTQVCQGGGSPKGITVSPDANRLFITCHNDPNNYVEAWDVSQSDGKLLASDTITAPTASIALPVSEDDATAGMTLTAENGCTTPVGITAKLTSTTYGTRLFVTCQNSDTIVPIDYSTGSGTAAIDTYAVNNVISTDAGTITNALTPPYVNACTQAGSSCPAGIDLMPNPALHFVTGGLAPSSSPVAMTREINSKPYYQYVTVAGGALPIFWSNPDNVLSTDPNCAGLSLNLNIGQITGTAANTNVTCGGANGFIIRVTDGAGQIVERAFTIPIQP
jgi:hypothetical protein